MLKSGLGSSFHSTTVDLLKNTAGLALSANTLLVDSVKLYCSLTCPPCEMKVSYGISRIGLP